jgi:hypothetical protein
MDSVPHPGLDIQEKSCFSLRIPERNVMDSILPGAMKPGLEKARSYSVIASPEIDELEKKVSKLIDGGNYRLHGQPFVFGDKICQAVAMFNIGK